MLRGGELGYFWKVLSFWSAVFILSLFVAFYTNWDRSFVGLTVGIIIGFLPAFILKVLSDLRTWNIENIEKIYAPLMSEIDNLFTYFSGDKKLDHAEELFDYGEIRANLLSADKWEQIKKENLFFRLYLDDKVLANELSDFYFTLSFYINNREEFLHSTLDPIFDRFADRIPSIGATGRDMLSKIKTVIRNLVLDAREPTSKPITLGFYAQFTTLFSDYDQVRVQVGIPEKTFDAFLTKIIEEIKDKKYDLLLEQRKSLLRDVHKIKSKLQKKLERARPI
jgi:hypothetical protein